MVAQKQARVLWGLSCAKKPKDLSAHESDKRGHGKGGGVYTTLLQSDTVQSYGRTKTVTRTVAEHVLFTGLYVT